MPGNSPATASLPKALADGRLLEDPRRWRRPLSWFHAAVYVASALGLALLLPGSRAGQGRFALLILAGILANALVCGAVSEPAARYGARVIFLLPMALALLWVLRQRNRASRAYSASSSP